MRTKVLSFLLAAFITAMDQFIKRWAQVVLRPKTTMPLIPGVLELRYTVNDGMAFSLLSGKQKFLIVVTGVILVGVMARLLMGKMSRLERLAWTLILGGGVGNWIDRVMNGQVVDYINVLFMRFAVFNFADICVSAGVGFLALSFVLDAIGQGSDERRAHTSRETQNSRHADA